MRLRRIRSDRDLELDARLAAFMAGYWLGISLEAALEKRRREIVRRRAAEIADALREPLTEEA